MPLSRLPGIGPKTASRLTFFLLHTPDDLAQDLADALQKLKAGTAYCPVCFNITAAGREMCEICESRERENGLVCVVEEPLDVLALERTDGFHGRYHVLHGALSPIEGITPEDLKIRELIQRVRSGGITEIILATNPSLEGDATAMYLRQQLLPWECTSPAWRAACRWAATWNTPTRTHCCGLYPAGRRWDDEPRYPSPPFESLTREWILVSPHRAKRPGRGRSKRHRPKTCRNTIPAATFALATRVPRARPTRPIPAHSSSTMISQPCSCLKTPTGRTILFRPAAHPPVCRRAGYRYLPRGVLFPATTSPCR